MDARALRLVSCFLIAVVACTCAFAETEKQLRILWLGSSSTYYHDAPRDAAQWITEADNGFGAESYLIGRSGTAVYKYLEPDFKFQYGLKPGDSVLDHIRKGSYDFVVLQIPTDYLAGRGDNDSQAFVKSLSIYCETIRNSGAEPIFYEQGWGEDELFDQGDALLLEWAAKLNVKTAACRTAWRRIRKERPDLELHNLPDQTHPGTLGKYVNLCCFYAVITGRSPEGLPFRESNYWPKLTPEEKEAASAKLKKMKIADPYVARLAGWMQQNSISTKTARLEDETARYFQRVAWRACNDYALKVQQEQPGDE